MFSGDWKAGLTDQDELSGYPSAASPLSALGIDPDEARANPDLLASLTKPSLGASDNPRPPLAAAMNPPQEEPEKPSTSAKTAGALGGAADTSTPAATSAPAATTTATPDPNDPETYATQGLGMLNKSLEGANKATDEITTTAPADVTRLTAQQEALDKKTPLRDAQGNILPEYKASTGQKIWRGVRGGLVGLLTGGIPGAAVGALEPQDIRGGTAYGDPNKKYQRAEDTREQQLASTQEQLKTAMETWRDVNKARQEKAGQYRATATTGKDLITGATGLVNAQNKPETEANKTKAKLDLDQKTFDLRTNQVRSDPTLSKLSPLQKALYVANGKLPDPRETTEGDIQAANMARSISAFKLSHGGKSPATLEEMNSVIAAAKGDLNKGKSTAATPQQSRAVADKKNAAIEKATAEYAKDPGQPDSLAEYNRQLQAAQNAYEEDISILGGDPGPHQVVSVGKDGQVKWTPQVAQAPVAPAAPAAPAPAPPAAKPQPAPDGTRRQAPDGTVEVKRNGKWEAE